MCGFESDSCPLFMRETNADTYRWLKSSCCTPSQDTGPSADNTFKNISGIYLPTSLKTTLQCPSYIGTLRASSHVVSTPAVK